MKPTSKDIRDVVSNLSEDAKSKSGIAKMTKLNKALKALGFEKITAEQRDVAMLDEDATEAPEGTVSVTLNDAGCTPLPIYVHGRQLAHIRIGETKTLPEEALEALKNSDADFTIEE